jgi:hypothetical protein
VCCKLKDGVQIVAATDCPKGHVVSWKLCVKPAPEVCCKLLAGYTLVPANQCLKSQQVPLKYCDTTDPVEICDDGIYGQCQEEDFDYTKQCNPKGWDCAPFGILADTNCDGKYDVCKECPTGTAPVDTNGDGCEDVCDCIDVGPVPEPAFEEKQ